ncbi:MAG TPA: hypothetical protein PKU91_04515, partial [Phycisphaerales bacterium]|nr:hypothetical protein [Phycisphaerales bacterium]
ASLATEPGQAMVLIGHDLHRGDHPARVIIGSRAIDWECVSGRGEESISLNIVLRGLVLGFSPRF